MLRGRLALPLNGARVSITGGPFDALPEAARTALLSRIPTQRMGSPEDIAAAVVYLASAESAWVTGQTLHVNGGMAMI